MRNFRQCYNKVKIIYLLVKLKEIQMNKFQNYLINYNKYMTNTINKRKILNNQVNNLYNNKKFIFRHHLN